MSQSLQYKTAFETGDAESAARRPLVSPEHNYDRKALLSHLQGIADDFPPAVRQRGINRNWNKYKFVLRQMSHVSDLLPRAGGTYLDLGSGAGIVPLVMAQAGLSVYVIDTWTEYADELDNLMGSFPQFRARFEKYGINWKMHDISQTPLPFSPQSFEVVSLFDVLEHLSRPANVIGEIYRLLRPGGLFFLTLPNVANLRNRLRLLLGTSPHPDPIENWFNPAFFGHYREMTMNELRRALPNFGFSIVDAKYTSACHWNTRLRGDLWSRDYRVSSIHQIAKLLYLTLTSAVPSFRYEIFLTLRKPLAAGDQ
jgi:2-polyprenyl-3-methyl-5-hydroxy-6-metoxy-1,4-benzoquinol methylase